MSASESSPIGTNLQESIEQLIAETVRRSQSNHEEETRQLKTALQKALIEVEAGQAAMARASELLRNALDAPAATPEPTPTPEEFAEGNVETFDDPIAEEASQPEAETAVVPHELDVVAHDVTIDIAKRLQEMLRDRDEVTSMKTRSFVNGELHLRLDMASNLEMATLQEWITGHKGRIATSTSSVLELRFEG